MYLVYNNSALHCGLQRERLHSCVSVQLDILARPVQEMQESAAKRDMIMAFKSQQGEKCISSMDDFALHLMCCLARSPHGVTYSLSGKPDIDSSVYCRRL